MFRYQEIANRLRAFRMGSGLSADEIARRLNISRTALYRFEKGELAKIETLEKLSELLNVSMPTLLGIGLEYIPSAVTYFERVRQFEEKAEHIIILSGTISSLLASDDYVAVIPNVLRENIPDDLKTRDKALAQVEALVEILGQRRERYKVRRPGILNLISARDIQRFISDGLVGSMKLPEVERTKRRALARAEVELVAQMVENEAIGVQIGLITETIPHSVFQIFRMADRKVIATSPFRLAEQVNIRFGLAMTTSAPDAVSMHETIVSELWHDALKGKAAAEVLRSLAKSAL